MIAKNISVRGIVVLAVAFIAFGMVGCAARDVDKDRHKIDVDLADLLSDDSLVREEARNEIFNAGVAAVPFLKEAAIEDEDVEIKKVAVKMLRELSQTDESAAGPARDALIDIYMRNDRDTVNRAAVALKAHGKNLLPRLAELASAMPAAEVDEPARWRHPVVLMLAIDREATIDQFISMLGESEYAQREATLNRILEEITNQTFGYDSDTSPAARQKVVKRWQEWWEAMRDR